VCPPLSGAAKTVADLRVANDAVQRSDGVAPADLLAVGVGAASVRDADLVDPPSALGYLGGDLGFEAESILLDGDRLITSRRKSL
jgi:hypothetical protein